MKYIKEKYKLISYAQKKNHFILSFSTYRGQSANEAIRFAIFIESLNLIKVPGSLWRLFFDIMAVIHNKKRVQALYQKERVKKL